MLNGTRQQASQHAFSAFAYCINDIHFYAEINDSAAIGLRIQGEYVRDRYKSQPLKVYVERFKLQIWATLFKSKEYYRL